MDGNGYDTENLIDEQLEKPENRHKICAYCEKDFYLPYIVDLEHYAYKLTNPTVKGKKTLKKYGVQLWFCSWSCLSKFRKSYSSKN